MVKKEPDEPPAEPSFEQSLAELETIVHQLEDGPLGLEESLARYEQGVKLLRRCHALLTQAQRRIELLSGVDAQGNPVTRPIEDESDTLEQKAARRSRRRSAAPEPPGPSEPNHLGDSTGPIPGGDDVDESRQLF